MNKLTQDQLAAIMRHYKNSAASYVVGFVSAMILFGYLSQEQLDQIIQAFTQLGDGWAKMVPLLLLLIPYLMGRQASQSASPAEQVKKVELNVPGVIVTPVDEQGAALLKEATGKDKPIETPTVVVQQ